MTTPQARCALETVMSSSICKEYACHPAPARSCTINTCMTMWLDKSDLVCFIYVQGLLE